MPDTAQFDPRFDTIIDRRGSACEKWDEMESVMGVSATDGLAMWVADTDFRPPQVVQDTVEHLVRTGVYGYAGDQNPQRDATIWWMATRHGWTVTRDDILITHGLVNGLGHLVDALTAPGDAVVLFTPVYHAFAAIITASQRVVVECPMVLDDGRYVLDFDAYDAQMTGAEKMLVLSSPHNPGGRVWSPEELRAIADFCTRHDLILASDEIHHDLVYPGHRHHVLATVAPDIQDRLVTMTSASKTFNIAGGKVGNLIITDPALRKRVRDRLKPFGMSRNLFGMAMSEAAYSPEGAAWVDDLMGYLDRNRKLFDAGIEAIPGVRSIRLEATFLSWIDFSATGMSQSEIASRIRDDARIAANAGPSFGSGGDRFMRFNIGLPRARIEEAVSRLQDAFRDLQ
ncbi:MAG: PatB family C-S lyase [Rhodobacteraceae bacterium]|nr:PatB family C-S lyase [Paracoccaceae bacterium]